MCVSAVGGRPGVSLLMLCVSGAVEGGGGRGILLLMLVL